jgi:hypothetical protein
MLVTNCLGMTTAGALTHCKDVGYKFVQPYFTTYRSQEPILVPLPISSRRHIVKLRRVTAGDMGGRHGGTTVVYIYKCPTAIRHEHTVARSNIQQGALQEGHLV